MPSTSSETNFITRLQVARLSKSLTNIAPMTTATFPNAIVPLIINTTAFLLIAVTKGSRKTVMPPVTGCTLPAVTAHVRETPPSLIPEGAETQPPTAAALIAAIANHQLLVPGKIVRRPKAVQNEKHIAQRQVSAADVVLLVCKTVKDEYHDGTIGRG